ncbi:MAG: hypothetical protein HY514_05160 [Candidatus Aenigmarchaeota archaeon]|nr:hypothetical protein [Candidatus Aenigmarchaeota archaeon]
MENFVLPLLSIVLITGCTAEPSIDVTTYPSTANLDGTVNITWVVKGPALNFQHTAVHYGYEHRPGNFLKTTTPDEAGYPALSDVYNGTSPATFTVSIPVINPGTLYFRAHAIINGAHYWSKEYTSTVKQEQGGQGLSGVQTISS